MISVSSENLIWVAKELCDSKFFKWELKGITKQGSVLVIVGATDDTDLMKYIKKENIKNVIFDYSHSACLNCKFRCLCGNEMQMVKCDMH